MAQSAASMYRAESRCLSSPQTILSRQTSTHPLAGAHTEPLSTQNKSSATSSSNQLMTDPAGLESKESSLSALPPSITTASSPLKLSRCRER